VALRRREAALRREAAQGQREALRREELRNREEEATKMPIPYLGKIRVGENPLVWLPSSIIFNGIGL
jgi:hypothetical protein